jgi:hypothetical protein
MVKEFSSWRRKKKRMAFQRISFFLSVSQDMIVTIPRSKEYPLISYRRVKNKETELFRLSLWKRIMNKEIQSQENSVHKKIFRQNHPLQQSHYRHFDIVTSA